jgi:hypothetical protein
LILCLVALPFGAYAGMIATDQVATTAQPPAARDKLRDFLARSEVRDQLQSLGIDRVAAQARAAALTDVEVARIAGRIDSLPAGGVSGAAALVGLIVVELIWYFWVK